MSYDCPLLPIPEILECFRESNINVTEHDLKNPDPRRWHDIYGQIFEALTSRSIEQVIQSLFRVERMQTYYHDLFEEGFAEMTFTRCLQSVLSRFGFSSFSIKDVIQPTPRRVHRISSIFLNAVRLIQGKRQDAEKIYDRIQSSRSEYEAVLNQNKKLKEILANAKERQPQRDAELQKLQKEFELEHQSCIELNIVQEEERRAVDELKFRVAGVDAERESLKQQMVTIQAEVEKMSLKIVQSPKRFKKELDRYKNKVDEMKAELASKEQSLSENRLLLEQTANKLTAVEKAVKLSKEVRSDQDNENEIDTEIQCLTDAHHEQKEIYNSCCLQEEDLTEKLNVRQEQKYKLSSQMGIREQSTNQQMTDLRQHQDKMKEKIKKVETETSQVVVAKTACLKELDYLETLQKEKKQKSQREISEALAEVSELHEVMSQEWAEFEAILRREEE